MFRGQFLAEWVNQALLPDPCTLQVLSIFCVSRENNMAILTHPCCRECEEYKLIFWGLMKVVIANSGDFSKTPLPQVWVFWTLEQMPTGSEGAIHVGTSLTSCRHLFQCSHSSDPVSIPQIKEQQQDSMSPYAFYPHNLPNSPPYYVINTWHIILNHYWFVFFHFPIGKSPWGQRIGQLYGVSLTTRTLPNTLIFDKSFKIIS